MPEPGDPWALGSGPHEIQDVAVVGEEALGEREKKFIEFSDRFEGEFVTQSTKENRTINDTLSIAWDIMTSLSEKDLKRIDPEFIKKFFKKG